MNGSKTLIMLAFAGPCLSTCKDRVSPAAYGHLHLVSELLLSQQALTYWDATRAIRNKRRELMKTTSCLSSSAAEKM